MKCSVKDCLSSSIYQPGKSFFRFPTEFNLRKKWLAAINRPGYIPSLGHAVCEDHFLEFEIQKVGERNRLKKDVVPSLNMNQSEQMETASTEINTDVSNITNAPYDFCITNFDDTQSSTSFTLNSCLESNVDSSVETKVDNSEITNSSSYNTLSSCYVLNPCMENTADTSAHIKADISERTNCPSNFYSTGPATMGFALKACTESNVDTSAGLKVNDAKIISSPSALYTSQSGTRFLLKMTDISAEMKVNDSEIINSTPAFYTSQSGTRYILKSNDDVPAEMKVKIAEIINSTPEFYTSQSGTRFLLKRKNDVSAGTNVNDAEIINSTPAFHTSQSGTRVLLKRKHAVSAEIKGDISEITNSTPDFNISQPSTSFASKSYAEEEDEITLIDSEAEVIIPDIPIQKKKRRIKPIPDKNINKVIKRLQQRIVGKDTKERISGRFKKERIVERLKKERIAERFQKEQIVERLKKERIAERFRKAQIVERLKKERIVERVKKKRIVKRNKNKFQIQVLLDKLKRKNLIGADIEYTLSQIIGPHTEIFENYFYKAKRYRLKRYDEHISPFALSLNFTSPKGYLFVRKCFDNFLPDLRILREWYKVFGCDPGFTKESFVAIKKACDEAKKRRESLFINVVFDEIPVKKHVDWDGEKSYGYVDTGDGGRSEIVATQVLVFMAVCLNRSWKIPLAFFPMTHMTSEQKANIIQLIMEELKETGAEIVGLTFDGETVNQTAFKILGCNIRDITSRTCFDLCTDFEKFIVQPDPCHMIKQVRDSLADLKIIINDKGRIINWIYIERLLNLQEKEEFQLESKIRQAQIYFTTEKIDVKLAVQIFNKSVADALDFCRKDLRMPEFRESKPLAQFIRIINDIFDIFNSRRISEAEIFKQALGFNNINQVLSYAELAIEYFSKLKLESGEKIIDSTRKIGFIGLIACLKNLKVLNERFVLSKKLDFIPMYKLNKDHLELFCSDAKMNLRRNDNPTVKQFIAAYKNFLTNCRIKEGKISNCISLEKTKILHINRCTTASVDAAADINNTSGRLGIMENADIIDNSSILDQQFSEEYSFAAYPTQLSEYVHHVVYYIAGLVVFKISQIIICPECVSALQESYPTYSSIAHKTRGKHKIPSDSVLKVCEKTESKLRSMLYFMKSQDIILKKEISLKVLIYIQNHFLDRTIFEDQQVHMECSSHYSSLLRLIAEKYLNTRCYFIAKEASEKVSWRQY